MKIKKNYLLKICSFAFVLVLLILLVACGNTNKGNDDEKRKESLKSVKDEVVSSLPLELIEGSSELSFKKSVGDIVISYNSSRPDVITNDGEVFYQSTDIFVSIDVTFKVELSTGPYEEKSSLIIIVRKTKSEVDKFNDIKNDIISNIPQTIKSDIELKTSSLYGSIVSYSSSNPTVLSDSGVVKKDVISEEVELSVVVSLNGKIYEPFVIKVVVATLVIDSTIEQKLYEIEMEIVGILTTSEKIKENIDMPTSSLYDSTIRYVSSDEGALSSSGIVGEDIKNKTVTLEFYITLSGFEYGPYRVNVVVNTWVNVNDNEYYSDIDGSLGGNSLKLALRSLITTTQFKITSYDDIKTVTAKTDADPDVPGNIILFYSRVSVSSKWDGGVTWNREHIWPRSKSWFQYTEAGSDIHHLRPTNPSINSSRGNKAYSTVTNSDFYAPNDVVKGDVARIIFYLLTRYKESDSYPITNVAKSMEMLLEWNKLDPVDQLEITRNEECFKLQGNRNPFIDFPDYADMIWGTLDINIHAPFDTYVKVNYVILSELKKRIEI